MTDGWSPPVLPLPPYGTAPGLRVDDATMLAAFAAGELPGHSELLHAEGPALLVDGDIPAGLRLSADVVMVRVDLPEELAHIRAPFEQALAAEGLTCLDQASTLGLPVALQVLGLRLSTWDLWGRDIDDAFDVLRRAAIGDQQLPASSRQNSEGWDSDYG